MSAPISNIKGMTSQELNNITLSNICEIGDAVHSINSIAGQCIDGPRAEMEFAVEATENTRCILCAISMMIESGDVDGLSRLKAIAVKEGGCAEYVSSN